MFETITTVGDSIMIDGKFKLTIVGVDSEHVHMVIDRPPDIDANGESQDDEIREAVHLGRPWDERVLAAR